MQAVEQLPRQLAKLDANLSVIHHHLNSLSDAQPHVTTVEAGQQQR